MTAEAGVWRIVMAALIAIYCFRHVDTRSRLCRGAIGFDCNSGDVQGGIKGVKRGDGIIANRYVR